jgi:hypothetical protein
MKKIISIIIIVCFAFYGCSKIEDIPAKPIEEETGPIIDTTETVAANLMIFSLPDDEKESLYLYYQDDVYAYAEKNIVFNNEDEALSALSSYNKEDYIEITRINNLIILRLLPEIDDEYKDISRLDIVKYMETKGYISNN